MAQHRAAVWAPKRSEVARVRVGDRIYYTGDMANIPWWATVINVTENDVEVENDEGRTTHIFPSAIGKIYRGHCNPRFVTANAVLLYHTGLNPRPDES